MQYQKILLIDDDEEDHEIFMTALSHVPGEFQCISFKNASDALQKLQSKELTVDVIFLDLNMPIMSGQEFLTQIKTKESIQNIPVIVFSTSSNPATVEQAKELGAINFITKLIDAAKAKIFDANKSVSEIAYELGFKYPQHFTRVFKQHPGVTPQEYRSSMN